MTGRVYQWLDRLQSALLPGTCILCGAPGAGGLDLCGACGEGLPYNRNGCTRCALPLPEGQAGGICGRCQRSPPPFDGCHSAFLYREPIAGLVGGLKFRGRLHQGRLLGELLARSLQAQPLDRPERLIPVPLHSERIRARGYNQALEIARWVARALTIPLDSESCRRTRATAAQSDLPLEERRRNIRGAFALVRPLGVRHLALLDDVVTSGATVSELAQVLKRGGVERVDVWAVARTE